MSIAEWRSLLQRSSLKLGVHEPDQWFHVRPLREKHLKLWNFLRKYFQGSLYRALVKCFPERRWYAWCFTSSAFDGGGGRHEKGVWKNPQVEREAVEWLGERLGFEKLDDWYGMSAEKLRFEEISGLLRRYSGSLPNLLMHAFPEHQWQLSKFCEENTSKIRKDSNNRIGSAYREWDDRTECWDCVYRQRDFFVQVGKWELDVHCPRDWYCISISNIKNRRARDLLRCYYGGSLVNALQVLFPEHHWLPWQFPSVPRGYWMEIEHQREWLDWLASISTHRFGQYKHKMTSEEEHVKGLLQVRGVSGVLGYYGGSMRRALRALHPEQFSLGKTMEKADPSRGLLRELLQFEESKNSERKCFDRLAQAFGIQKPSDWSRVRAQDLARYGVYLRGYGGSLLRALQSVYPNESCWQPWIHHRVPRNFWRSEMNAKRFVHWLASELNLKSPYEWSQVSFQQICALGGSGLLARYGGLRNLFARIVPDANDILAATSIHVCPKKTAWIETHLKCDLKRRLIDPFTSISSKSQQHLFKCTQQLFPNEEVFLNVRHPLLTYENGQRLELDVFLPSLNLILEYNGEQHYLWNYRYGSPSSQQLRDKERRLICDTIGLTILEVPFWWDHKEDTLAMTIRRHRPDLLSQYIPVSVLHLRVIPMEISEEAKFRHGLSMVFLCFAKDNSSSLSLFLLYR